MEDIYTTTTNRIENYNYMKATEEGNSNSGCYNIKSKVREKNSIVDCIHVNLNDKIDEQDKVDEDVQVVKDIHIHRIENYESMNKTEEGNTNFGCFNIKSTVSEKSIVDCTYMNLDKYIDEPEKDCGDVPKVKHNHIHGMETYKDMSSTLKANTNLECYNFKSDISEKNFVDCTYMNSDKNVDESKEFDEDVPVVNNINDHYKISLPISVLWPENVVLYQPDENEQILFSEMPNCLYVQAFLRMCNLPYTVVLKTNTEYIGPTREVPVLKCGTDIVSGADKIIQFIKAKRVSLTGCLRESEKSEISFYTSLVQMSLAKAEDFITWLEPETYKKITRNWFCSVYPWPLSSYLAKKKQQQILNKLDAMGWACKTFEDVCDEIDKCFNALSVKMEGNYVFGNHPTRLDALVFAHAYTIMTNPLPKSQLAGIILRYPKVVKHCYVVMNSYFNDLNTTNQFAELVNNLSS